MTRARADEYRRRAQECLDLAREISLERDRAVVLDMAQSWLRLAEEQEAAVIQPPPVAEQPQPAAEQQQQTQPKDDVTRQEGSSLKMKTLRFTKGMAATPKPPSSP